VADEDPPAREAKSKTNEKDAPPTTPRSTRAIVLCAVATLILGAVDIGSKVWVQDNLSTERRGDPPPVCEADDRGYIQPQRRSSEPMVLVEGSLELRYAENCGAAFSMFRDAPAILRTGLFGAAAVLATIALFWMFIKGRGGRWFAYAVPLVVSGALGNLADRIRLGYVVDFVRFHWTEPIFGYTEWPTWNIADATILIGVLFLLIDGWVEGKKEKAAEAAEKAADAAG